MGDPSSKDTQSNLNIFDPFGLREWEGKEREKKYPREMNRNYFYWINLRGRKWKETEIMLILIFLYFCFLPILEDLEGK